MNSSDNPECIFPEELKFDNSNQDDRHYYKQAQCYNCDEDFWWIKVPKGEIKSEWEKTLTCPRCEVKGKIGVW